MCLMVRSRIIESETDGSNNDELCESREFKYEKGCDGIHMTEKDI